ncbi:Branched-chain amino acid ABC transporter, amino acid-binding protein [Lachnospiraceae bacterium TWA4]|nr:Branched-chain amino acid ABC transporter, amino acid-binding protein [Lachnospiraceae bacterium TWA4]
MKKKAISLLVATAMTASVVVGCSGGSGSETTAAQTEAKTTQAQTEAKTTGAETKAADSNSTASGTFKIGSIGPITGGAANYGQNTKNGAELAVEEINAMGGIQFEFNFQDDEHDAEKSVNAYNTLKDWGMQLLMGCVTSTPSTAVAAKTAEDNMYQLTPSGSAVACIEKDNAFRVCFSDPNQGLASAQYIGSHNLAQKVAIIYNSSDVYSTGIYEKFVTESANQPFEVVSEQAFTEDNKTDFSTQLQQAQSSGADLVFLPIYYDSAALILQQASGMGFAPTWFGCDGLDGILGVQNFDTKLAEGVMLLTPFAADAKDERTQSFVKAYKEKYGDTPTQFAADGYDAMYIIKAALEKANATSDMSVSDLCEAMKKAMTEITVDGLTGTGITWSADGEPTKDPKAVKIQDGVYTAME